MLEVFDWLIFFMINFVVVKGVCKSDFEVCVFVKDIVVVYFELYEFGGDYKLIG